MIINCVLIILVEKMQIAKIYYKVHPLDSALEIQVSLLIIQILRIKIKLVEKQMILNLQLAMKVSRVPAKLKV